MITTPWLPAQVSYSVLVTPPAEEPLTLAEAKLRAGLSWPTTEPADPRDQLMKDYLAAARSQVERDTGLALLTQIRDVYFVTLPDGRVGLPSQAQPVQQVLSVSAEPLPEPGPSGLFAVAAVDPAFAGFSSGVARLVVGWPTAADLRIAAPLLVQAVGLLTAHFATAGRDAVITGTIASENPVGYEDAIASYRLIWVA